MTFDKKNIPLVSGETKISMPMVTQREKKIKCLKCLSILEPDDVRTRREYHSLEDNLYEDLPICGVCGDEELEEVTKCEGCDTYLTDYESETEGFCDNCIAELQERFAIVMEQFTPGEQLALETLGRIGDGL